MRTSLPMASLATAASLALVLTGCSSGTSSAPAASGAAGDKITLTVATFNEFGYDNLYAEYMAANPGVVVTQKKAATSNEARDNMTTRLAAGSGLSDVEAVEVDWLPDLMQNADKFVDLKAADVDGRWLDWKTKAATTTDGHLIGYGTDIGPEAICYRSDLFAKAGLPTDREEVAKLLTGDWANDFAVGKRFVAASGGVAWFDSAGGVFQARLNQVANPYSSTSDKETLIPLADNAAVKDIYTTTVTAATTDKLSANLAQWSKDWTSAFQSGKFATMQCPGWMLGVIEGNAAGVKGWDIANVFPGGGGNWGGSYLTVPAQGKHLKEAQKLAAWLTAPEQQIKAFKAKGTFPSQVKALTDAQLTGATNAFFNNAPTGKILADRAKAVTVQPFKGPHYFALTTIISDAITRVDVDKKDSIESSWTKAVEEAGALK